MKLLIMVSRFPPTVTVTVTVKGKLPVCVGVPLITPVEAKPTPVGSEPLASAHVKFGPVPPISASVVE